MSHQPYGAFAFPCRDDLGDVVCLFHMGELRGAEAPAKGQLVEATVLGFAEPAREVYLTLAREP